MLSVIRDSQGHLEAAIDYYLVNENGQVVFDGSGNKVWIERLEVSCGIDGRERIKTFIRWIAEAIPHATGAYWIRNDKPGSKVFHYSRERLVRFSSKGEEVMV